MKNLYRLIAASNTLALKLQNNNSDIFGKLDSLDFVDLKPHERDVVVKAELELTPNRLP